MLDMGNHFIVWCLRKQIHGMITIPEKSREETSTQILCDRAHNFTRNQSPTLLPAPENIHNLNPLLDPNQIHLNFAHNQGTFLILLIQIGPC
jgi:hypothetical protein